MASIITSSRFGQLKPEVRLGQAISQFSASLKDQDDNSHNRFQSLLKGPQPQPLDVAILVEEINQQASQTHSAWKPYGTRVHGFLSQVQSLVTIGDVVIGGSQNVIACGVWATVRLSLFVTLKSSALFEKISALLMRVCRTATIQKDLVQVYPNDRALRDMVFEYLLIIVRLCRSFVRFRTKNVFTRFCATFDVDKELQDAEDHLIIWANLINDQVRVLHSNALVRQGNQLSRIRKNQEIWGFHRGKEHNMARYIELMKSLSPDQDDFDRIVRRERRKGQVNWIFDSIDFDKWRHGRLGGVMTITGSLGRGKTVLLSNIASHLPLARDQQVVATFFCQRSNSKTLDPDIILASLAYQFIKAAIELTEEDQVASIFYSGLLPKDPETIRRLVTHAVRGANCHNYYILIDGLDDLQPKELTYLIAELKEWEELADCIFRICVTSRSKDRMKELWQEKGFEKHFDLNIGGIHHENEIKIFIDAELKHRVGFQKLTDAAQELIQDLISKLANGMYLWATLQIERLFPRYSDAAPTEDDILGLANNVPAPLYDLFSQVLDGLLNAQHQPSLFKLLIGAKRSLTPQEALVSLSIDIDLSTLHADRLTSDLTIMVYINSGGLVELDEEANTLHFIHDSVYYFLTNQTQDNHIPSTVQSHWDLSPQVCDRYLASVCLTYLDLPFHRNEVVKVKQNPNLGTHTLQAVERSVTRTSKLGRLTHFMIQPASPPRTLEIDIAAIAQRYLEEQRERRKSVASVSPVCLLGYASKYWLEHSDHFMFDLRTKDFRSALKAYERTKNFMASALPVADSLARKFYKVISGRSTALVQMPFCKPGGVLDFKQAMLWANEHGHVRLTWHLLLQYRNPDSIEVYNLKALGVIKSVRLQMQRAVTELQPITWNIDIPFHPYSAPFLRQEKTTEGASCNRFDVDELVSLLSNEHSRREVAWLVKAQLCHARKKSKGSWENTGIPKQIILMLFMIYDLFNCSGRGESENEVPRSSPQTLVQSVAERNLHEWSRPLFHPFYSFISDLWGTGLMSKIPPRARMFATVSAQIPCHLPNSRGITPLEFAISSGDIDSISDMLFYCKNCTWADQPQTLQVALTKATGFSGFYMIPRAGREYLQVIERIFARQNTNDTNIISNDVLFRRCDHRSIPIHESLTEYARERLENIVELLNGAGASVRLQSSKIHGVFVNFSIEEKRSRSI